MNAPQIKRHALIRATCVLMIGGSLCWACLEDPIPEPLPPLAEDLRYDGGQYEPPSSPNSSGSGYGYGSGSSSSSAYGSGVTSLAGEEAP